MRKFYILIFVLFLQVINIYAAAIRGDSDLSPFTATTTLAAQLGGEIIEDLTTFPNPETHTPEENFSTFNNAVKTGRYAAVQAMIKAGYNVNGAYMGATHLVTACHKCDLRMVELLLANGAKDSINYNAPFYGNPFGFYGTPLNVSLIMLGSEPTAKEIVKLLVASGADVKSGEIIPSNLTPSGISRSTPLMEHPPTPLIVCLRSDYRDIKPTQEILYEVVELFLNHGAATTINIPDDVERTAIALAAEYGDNKLLALLLRYGANPAIGLTYGMNVLDHVLSKSPADVPEALELILGTGTVNPNELDGWNRTPLLRVVQKFKDKTVRRRAVDVLLRHGAAASINQLSLENETSLLAAVLERDSDLVDLLLANGADPALGRYSDGSMLEAAVVFKDSVIANALSFALGNRPLMMSPKDYYKMEREAKGTTLLHILALGGDHYIENIQKIMKTPNGLEALHNKDEQGKLPEQLLADSDLRELMKSLGESYKRFKSNLRTNISGDLPVLNSLMNIANHIIENAVNFPVREVDKARRILLDQPIAEKVTLVNAKILLLDEIMERLSCVMGDLKATPAKNKKRIHTLNESIHSLCTELIKGYTEVKTLAGDIPLLLADLETGMGILYGRGSFEVDNLLKKLGIAHEGSASAGAAGGAGRVAKEVDARDTLAGGFDLETAALDLETLSALGAAKGPQRKAIESTLLIVLEAAKAASADRGEETDIVVEADVREALGEKYLTSSDKERAETRESLQAGAIRRYVAKLKKVTGHDEALRAIQKATGRSVNPLLVWKMLRFSTEEPLAKIHAKVMAMATNDKGTVVTRSVDGSLITPGGKLRASDMDGGASTMGGSVLGTAARDDDFDGLGVDDIGAGGSVDFEAGGGIEEDVFKGVAIPRVDIMPLHRSHLETILKLFAHDYTNLAEDGTDLCHLFRALGDRYAVKYTAGSKTKINSLQITDNVAAAALTASSKDPKHATIAVDAKHASYGFAGPKPRLAAGALKLLTNAGVTKAIVEARLPVAATGGAGAAFSASRSVHVSAPDAALIVSTGRMEAVAAAPAGAIAKGACGVTSVLGSPVSAPTAVTAVACKFGAKAVGVGAKKA